MSIEEISTPIDKSYWVIPGRFRAGEYPGSIDDDEARRRLHWLLEHQTNLIIDLTAEGESSLRPYEHVLNEEAQKISRVVLHKRIPLQDFSIPGEDVVAEILDMIDLALSLGKNVYLHCFAGNGRTGTVVGCYLVRHGMTGKEALETLQVLRRDIPGRNNQSPELEGQKRMVLEWKKGQ